MPKLRTSSVIHKPKNINGDENFLNDAQNVSSLLFLEETTSLLESTSTLDFKTNDIVLFIDINYIYNFTYMYIFTVKLLINRVEIIKFEIFTNNELDKRKVWDGTRLNVLPVKYMHKKIHECKPNAICIFSLKKFKPNQVNIIDFNKSNINIFRLYYNDCAFKTFSGRKQLLLNEINKMNEKVKYVYEENQSKNEKVHEENQSKNKKVHESKKKDSQSKKKKNKKKKLNCN